MSGPLTAVLDSFAGGAHSVGEITARTGLDRDVVEAGIAHLVRLGRLDRSEIGIGCPDGGCGGCAQKNGCSSAARTRGLVALTLTRRPQ